MDSPKAGSTHSSRWLGLMLSRLQDATSGVAQRNHVLPALWAHILFWFAVHFFCSLPVFLSPLPESKSRLARQIPMTPMRMMFSLRADAMVRPPLPARHHLAAAALLCLGVLAPAAVAEVSLPNVFSDHMVLQRRQANRVWGKAAAGEKVTVTFGAQSHAATAGMDGAWQVTLAP